MKQETEYIISPLYAGLDTSLIYFPSSGTPPDVYGMNKKPNQRKRRKLHRQNPHLIK